MKYPGKLPNAPMEDWFAQAAAKVGDFAERGVSPHKNPCVAFYGPDPGQHKCKECRLLFRHHCSKTYFKCELRKFTHGPGSDHRANWPACARFVPVPK